MIYLESISHGGGRAASTRGPSPECRERDGRDRSARAVRVICKETDGTHAGTHQSTMLCESKVDTTCRIARTHGPVPQMEASTATRGSVCRWCLTRLRGVPARGVPARGVSGRGEATTPSIRALAFCIEWSCCSHGPSSPPPG